MPAVFVAAVAASLVAGCSSAGPTEIRRCVDASGNVLPDQYCDQPGMYRSSGIHYYGTPHWGYGGSMQGNVLRGFAASPSSDAEVVTPSGRTISRGGFGGSGSGGFG
ncbi:hypothetical protein OP10G_0731 [Fimbriimonas ginsengisoli Gsoil 348]|uniref:Lipoprotein n=1 Tax=Fimbriimonas ginsengisoli Gsoil 348 TaxID=661478 RepID=A0A068NR93_FIMGI|nr:hypothetical protein OP10G_0731 [Fimbriimonas ginsengisoli Gsoil 348]